MDKLAEIIAFKRREIEGSLRPVREQELSRLADNRRGAPSFAQALSQSGQLNVISEIKRKSPSAGDIAPGRDATEQAIHYYNAGADAFSVLTDTEYFGGTIKDLWEVTDLLQQHQRSIPCLRKDFMVHPIQVVEAAEAGASAILIITGALPDDEIKALYEAANLAGLDSLFEVHSEAELEKALRFEPQIVGVNNRDLKQFTTDLAHSELIIPQIPPHIIRVSESGIFDIEDAERARACGAQAILVGEALMRAEDPEALVEAFHQA